MRRRLVLVVTKQSKVDPKGSSSGKAEEEEAEGSNSRKFRQMCLGKSPADFVTILHAVMKAWPWLVRGGVVGERV